MGKPQGIEYVKKKKEERALLVEEMQQAHMKSNAV